MIYFLNQLIILQARPNGIVKTMISQSKDGEIIAKVYSLFGIDSIRGSSSKGATKALISTIREIKSGVDVALTPDGPRGPRHTVADGVIAIAQKSSARIVVLNSKPSSYWQFNSWDKFVLPKPFGKIDFYMSEPFNINDLEFEEARNFIKDKMMLNAIL
ncbi:MAG: lysophospholipid acyltransferase family protein [Aliarcobacter sp.]|nr:lysophospholipid acyltransferase family protein [Aliarcobacter sp.]